MPRRAEASRVALPSRSAGLRSRLRISRASAALAQRISTQSVLRVASDAGLRGLPDVPSLALGTGEARGAVHHEEDFFALVAEPLGDGGGHEGAL